MGDKDMRKLTVNGRYLVWEDGEPFFYLGDTAWELLHALNREEMEYYFEQRARQGFNAVQTVALAELDGTAGPNAYGRQPLLYTEDAPDPAKPDTEGEYSYWDHVDFAVDTAAQYGIFIVLLPTWGDKFNVKWGKGPEIFTPENAYSYGKWIAARYAEKENIIWMLGGDRPLETPLHRTIIDEMARGILEADKNHLVTFHPCGASRSTDWVGDAPYIDFHTAQTGHDTSMSYRSDEIMLEMASASDKPYLDSESRYEDHPACFDASLGYYWDAADMRQNAYWNLMTGVCGQTYGNHCIWSMTRQPTDYFPFKWDEALLHIGAEQFAHLGKLRLSRDFASFRHAPELIAENFGGMGHMTAARGDGYGYVYSPLGVPFTVNLEAFAGAKRLRASWFDPRTGEEKVFGVLPAAGKTLVVPPSQGKGCDWVLVLEEV